MADPTINAEVKMSDTNSMLPNWGGQRWQQFQPRPWPPRQWRQFKPFGLPPLKRMHWPPPQWEQFKPFGVLESDMPASILQEKKAVHWEDSHDIKNETSDSKVDPVLETDRARTLLNNKRELCFSGGGGAGGALVSALLRAIHYGLDLSKIERVNATSVGVFIALAVVLEIPPDEWKEFLAEMPRDQFQDWNWWQSLNGFSSTWAWCKGEAMTNYFRRVLKERTGLDDPSFEELYEAGYGKEFCINTTNLSTGSIGIFSHRRTPHKKVAETMTLACTVPGVFPPQWIVDASGKRGLHADGGILNNFPWGIDSPHDMTDEERLGFIFVNQAVGYGVDGQQEVTIDSFWSYIKQVFWTFVFKHPLSQPDSTKANVVGILLNHHPMIFDPNEEQQAHLDESGEKAVDNHIVHKLERMDKMQASVAQSTFEKMAACVEDEAKQRKMSDSSESLLLFKEFDGGSPNPVLQSDDRAIVEDTLNERVSSPLCAPAA